MNAFYNITQSIKDAISAEPFTHTVTFGDVTDIDLKKQSLFPMAHVQINTASINNNYVTFNVTIFYMDLVDISNTQTTDLFLGNDNEQDVLNTQLALATRINRVLQKADLYRDQFELLNVATCEPFTERFDNKLAGWAVTFDCGTKSEMTHC